MENVTDGNIGLGSRHTSTLHTAPVLMGTVMFADGGGGDVEELDICEYETFVLTAKYSDLILNSNHFSAVTVKLVMLVDKWRNLTLSSTAVMDILEILLLAYVSSRF